MLLSTTLALAAPLLVEPFASPTFSPDWRTRMGARVGIGPTSTIQVEDGALWFRVTTETREFPAVVRTVPTGDSAWIRVSARMTTQGVDPAPARYRNCNAFVRLGGGPVQALPVLSGDTPWTTVSRTFAVPDGVDELDVGMFLSMPGAAAFDDLQVEAVDPGWRGETSGVFVYHLLPGDTISEAQKARNSKNLAEIVSFLGVDSPKTINFWKYPDNATKAEYTGDRGNGHALRDSLQLHTIWRVESHELVHLVAGDWGDPPALLAEGLAVWLSGAWQDQPIASYAAGLGDKWVPYAELASTSSFRQHDDRVTYAQAGALVGWLAETKGTKGLRKVYKGLARDAGAKQLEAAVGLDLDALDTAVRTWAAAHAAPTP